MFRVLLSFSFSSLVFGKDLHPPGSNIIKDLSVRWPASLPEPVLFNYDGSLNILVHCFLSPLFLFMSCVYIYITFTFHLFSLAFLQI